MRIKHGIIIYMGITITFLMITTGIVSASEIHVYPGDSIQDAINNANSSDTIIVYPSVYKENIVINKSLTIKSKSGNPEYTVVKAANPHDHVVHIIADDVVINGFTFKGALWKWHFVSGIHLNSVHNVTISNNIASNNEFGIELSKSSNNKIFNNIVESNEKDGILILESDDNGLIDNAVNLNGRGGIFVLYHSDNNKLINNSANFNEEFGISLSGSGNILKNNSMSSNRYNFKVSLEDTANDIDKSNYVENKRIYYLVDASNITIDSSSKAGVIYCINCQNVTVKDLNVRNNHIGVHFYNTTNSYLYNSTASNNLYGI